MTNTLTQRERILNLLRERGRIGVKVWELIAPRPTGLGISQYGARIFELRRNGFRIINKEPGHFVLEEIPKFKEEPINQEATVNQLSFYG